MIEIASVGGYSEVGKNMTAVKVDDEVVLLDMGLYIPAVMGYEDEQNFMGSEELIKIGAIPNDNKIKDWWKLVKGIVIGHAHLDHLGGAPYLSGKYKAPIYGTPYTIEVLRRINYDKGFKVKNKLMPMSTSRRFSISENIKCELVNVTHSTLQTVIIVLFTKYGNIVYANDFKIDETPVLGKKTNMKSLKKLNNVKILFMDCLYAKEKERTPSESVARNMLIDVLINNETKGRAIIVTTFSSHIARLKTILDCGKKLKRKVVFLGRSLGKYVEAAEATKLVKFKGEAEVIVYPRKIAKKLREIEKSGRGKYLIVCTGHQGEPRSVLSKILNGTYPFEFKQRDIVVFSSNIIPTEASVNNREIMEGKLKIKKIKIYRDIHQSGHLSGKDMVDFIKIIKPKHIVPCQGDEKKLTGLYNLSESLGYEKKKTVHLLKDGDRLKLD